VGAVTGGGGGGEGPKTTININRFTSHGFAHRSINESNENIITQHYRLVL
jgi:hypothetical protein